MKVNNLKNKILCGVLVVMLTMATVCMVVISAATYITVDESPNYRVYAYYGYASAETRCNTEATVLSQPTYGTVSTEGDGHLTLDKKNLLYWTPVLSLKLKIYKSRANKTDFSYNLGKAKGDPLSFGIDSE